MENNKFLKISLIVLIVLLVISIAIFAAYYILKNYRSQSVEQSQIDTEDGMVVNVADEENSDDKKVQIFQGTNRPIAVMIDNNVNAWPQYSINKAYIIYEIIVEGKETRLMALFKNEDVDVVGPIRSSRHYFLDYALENDAIYAHLGWSPQAQKDISSLGVNNINGQVYDTGAARTASSKYWREQSRKAPHNAFTSIKSLYEIASSKGYRTTSDKKSVLNYVTKEVNLEEGMNANNVSIPYSSSNIVKYVYNSELGKYERYSKGVKQKDGSTGEDVVVKNIIVTFAKNYNLTDTEKKGRQQVDDVGTLDGYYITNGKAIKIKCEKSSRSAQTIYKDLEGNEIEVNDGNTFVQICPIDANVQIN